MKKGSVILIAVLAVVAVIVIALVGGYNSMVNAQTDVEQKQADIQNTASAARGSDSELCGHGEGLFGL